MQLSLVQRNIHRNIQDRQHFLVNRDNQIFNVNRQNSILRKNDRGAGIRGQAYVESSCLACAAGHCHGESHRIGKSWARLEDEHLDGQGQSKIARRGKGRIGQRQMTLFAPYEHPLLEEIRNIDIDATTPLAALALLKAWQELAGQREPELAAKPR